MEVFEIIREAHKKYEQEYLDDVEVDDGNPFRDYVNLYDTELCRVDYKINEEELFVQDNDTVITMILSHDGILNHYYKNTIRVLVMKVAFSIWLLSDRKEVNL